MQEKEADQLDFERYLQLHLEPAVQEDCLEDRPDWEDWLVQGTAYAFVLAALYHL